MKTISVPRLALVGAAALGLFLTQPDAQAAPSATLTTVYSFDSSAGFFGGPLTLGPDGAFYGASDLALFRLTQGGEFTPLYFKTTSDRSFIGGLALGPDGNLYGINGGGSHGAGAFYRLTVDGTYTVLYSFEIPSQTNIMPGNIVLGKDGNFYGIVFPTTNHPNGAVIRLTTDGVYSYAYDSPVGVFSGEVPLSVGDDGNFYGAFPTGGASGGSVGSPEQYGNGLVFRLTPDWKLTVLHTFSLFDTNDPGGPGRNQDGASPLSGLAQGADGSIYGQTLAGGEKGEGTLFRITQNGVFTTLRYFGFNLDESGDEASPAGLVRGSDGNFYETAYDADSDRDTIFRLTPESAYTTVFTFPMPKNDAPVGPLIFGTDGCIYGEKSFSNDELYGVVYRLDIGLPPAFFDGEVPLDKTLDYLEFASGAPFGYYAFLNDPHYIYHLDLGYEYVFDAADGKDGVYFYDFTSKGYFYTSPTFPFPYLYDFSLKTVLYYFPDPNDPGHYNTDGVRYFYDFATRKIIAK